MALALWLTATTVNIQSFMGAIMAIGVAVANEGGEQTAPLGRAVVGGLVAATLATLFVLPAVFAIVQARAHRRSASLDPDDVAGSHLGGGAAAT